MIAVVVLTFGEFYFYLGLAVLLGVIATLISVGRADRFIEWFAGEEETNGDATLLRCLAAGGTEAATGSSKFFDQDAE